MADSAAATQAPDLPRIVEERTLALAKLYERHAYLVYNLALRITGEREAALTASRRAFLAVVASADADSELIPATVKVSLAEASSARGSWDDPVLAANCRVVPAKRAVLALTALAEKEPEELAAMVGVSDESAAQLVDTSFERLAVGLERSPAEAREAYLALPWTEPPAELWQALYPELHQAVAQHAREAIRESTPTLTVVEDPAPAKGGRLKRREREGKRRLRPRRSLVLLLVLLAAGGVAASRYAGGEDAADTADTPGFINGFPESEGGGGDGEGGRGGSDGGGSGYTALTPQELDKLRNDELEDLKVYAKKQTGKRLSPEERADAARRYRALQLVARRRERAAKAREKALVRALRLERRERLRDYRRRQREERRRQKEGTPAAPEPKQQEPDQKEESTPPPEGTGSKECLRDEDTGTFICPDG